MLDVADNSGCATASTANDPNSFHAWNGDTANLLLQNWNFCYLASYVVKLHGYGRVRWHCGLLKEFRIVEISCIRWWWCHKLKADEVCNFEIYGMKERLRYELGRTRNMKREEWINFVRFWEVLLVTFLCDRLSGLLADKIITTAVRKRQRAKWFQINSIRLLRLSWWDYLNTR